MNVLYVLTSIFLCLFLFCITHLQIALESGVGWWRFTCVYVNSLSLVGHLAAKAWTAAWKRRNRKRGGTICDTNPPPRIFWRWKGNVGNSLTMPRRWALSRHDRQMRSSLYTNVDILGSFNCWLLSLRWIHSRLIHFLSFYVTLLLSFLFPCWLTDWLTDRLIDLVWLAGWLDVYVYAYSTSQVILEAELQDGGSFGPPCGKSLNCSWNPEEQEHGRDGLWHKPTPESFREVRMESREFLD